MSLESENAVLRAKLGEVTRERDALKTQLAQYRNLYRNPGQTGANGAIELVFQSALDATKAQMPKDEDLPPNVTPINRAKGWK